jgi:hypothetical protein
MVGGLRYSPTLYCRFPVGSPAERRAFQALCDYEDLTREIRYALEAAAQAERDGDVRGAEQAFEAALAAEAARLRL